ncbi:MAG: 50S ribosomal protein L11 methyltransferase [Pedobacter sp.]|nr:MAG: 50S ribosomal protein L11 methyltransferase [Pedobacter sp.]
MNYIQVNFKFPQVESYQQDWLIAELAEIGFDTFQDNEEGFSTFIKISDWDEAVFQNCLMNLPALPPYNYEIIEVEGQNWNAEWEKNFDPIAIGDKCFVRATFHAPQPQYPYEIIIDPKMSFGTGHHQTTSMMLQYILEDSPTQKRVLDMGAGTGILAILAHKLGAKHIVAIDYDELCYDSMQENVQLNGVPDMKIILGGKEVIPAEDFDIIYANINRNILMDQLAVYAQVIKPSGYLYMSGFYEEPDLGIISEKAKSLGLNYINHKKQGEWVAAKFNMHQDE